MEPEADPRIIAEETAIKELRDAAYEGRADHVRKLLAAGLPLRPPQYGGSEALRWAIYGCHLDLIRELLACGVDQENDSTHPETSIAAAARLTIPCPGWLPDRRPLELLLAAGARLRLQEAVLLNDLPLARTRMEEGADPNFGEGAYHGPVVMIAAKAGFADMVDLLLDFGADIEGKDDLWQFPLMSAAARGQLEVVRRLVKRGAALNAGWPDKTALSEAIVGGHLDLYHWLLAQGAERGPVDAVMVGDLAWLDHYLDATISEDRGVDRVSVYPLPEMAVRRGDVAILRSLLRRGVRLSGPLGNYFLLAEAARFGHLEIIRLLLDHGADPHEADHDGLTPLAWAIREKQDEAADLLRRAGATR